ncbi:MAG TPA: TIGR03118 family protein [Thermoanaerobaculia bacterium]
MGFASAAPKNNYQATILVSNEADEAPVVDPLLVNAWGIAATDSSPWWVSNNGTGTSTIYTGAGVKRPLEVMVPGAPTGMVSSSSSQFLLSDGAPAVFMWASEDGTISGWNGGLTPITQAVVVFPTSGVGDPNSNYKGLAIHGDTLYTTDFGECQVETIDGTFTEFDSAGGFQDSTIPAGYCPFGIQAIGDSIFVTYALKSGADDVAGQGHGFVREFDTDGNLVAAVADRGQLNSPWGMAQAASDFGRFSGCLLVGNFGDGRINAFCKDEEGEWGYGGRLRSGKRDLVVDGLWGIGFGNGASSGPTNTLYFAAGPDDEQNGYFGKIEVAQ